MNHRRRAAAAEVHTTYHQRTIAAATAPPPTPPRRYRIKPSDAAPPVAHAILLRSHKIQDEDVPLTCRAIARCGAGTNNCNVPRMTELGVPVFNTPGANANAVKELVLCGLFLASRGVYEGANHMVRLHADGTAHDQIEKVKAQYGGAAERHRLNAAAFQTTFAWRRI